MKKSLWLRSCGIFSIVFAIFLTGCSPVAISAEAEETLKAQYREQQRSSNVISTLEMLDNVEEATLDIGAPNDNQWNVEARITTKSGEPLTQDDTDIITNVIKGAFEEETTVIVYSDDALVAGVKSDTEKIERLG